MDKVKIKNGLKRSLAILIGIVLVLGFMPRGAWAAGGSYTTFSDYADEDIVKITFTSDVHLNENSYNRPRLTNFLTHIKEEFDPDMLVFCGDLSTMTYSPPAASVYAGTTIGSSFSNPYDEVRAVVDYYMGADFPIVMVAGNHEYDNGSSYYTSNSGFSSYYGLVPTENFDVYMFGAPNGNSSYTYSTDEINALDTYLRERPNKDKPVFVAAHFPVDDTSRNASNASAVIDVLDSYDQPIVYLWGHNHDAPRSSMSELLKEYASGYTTANAGAIGYRNVTDMTQGLNLTIDLDDNEMEYSFMRIPTSGSISIFGTHTQALTDDASGSDAETPQIVVQPEDITVNGDLSVTLSVSATVDSGTLSYQWYSNTTRSTTGGTLIDGATGSTYTIPSGVWGLYYYCVITNTDTAASGEQTANTTSAIARVEKATVINSSVWDGTVGTSFGGGTGTSGDPYIIASGAQLAYLAQQVNAGTTYSSKYFKQTSDIDLNSLEWTPIGIYISSSGSNKQFAGTYDGDGNIIANLKINQSFSGTSSNNKGFGLFGFVAGTVKNLGLTDVNVSAANTSTSTSNGNAYVGGIAGYLGHSSYSSGYIYNSYAEGTVYASTNNSSARCASGGLCGYFGQGTVGTSYSAAAASKGGTSSSGNSGAGGLAGYRDSGTFSTSYWDTTLTTYGMNSSSSAVSGATGKTKTEMQEAAFVTLLNTNRGSYKEWMEDDSLNEGYPIHLRVAGPVDAEEPQITGQPVDKTVNVGGTASLSVTASVSKGVLSYQWYNNAARSSTGGTLITGATDDDYSASTSTAGTTYYYCVVTNTDPTATGSQTAQKPSDAAEVAVSDSAGVWDGTVGTSFGGGTGTSGDPYIIANGEQLAYLAQQVNGGTTYADKSFRQTADIDLDNHEWTPIGIYVSSSGSNKRFSGMYDGDGYIIANLKISQSFTGSSTNNKGFGLFGYLTGTVQNLGLTDASISAANTTSSSSNCNAYAGGIVAYMGHSSSDYSGYIYNSYVEGTVYASTNNSGARCAVGGLCGQFAQGSIRNSYSAAAVTKGGSNSSSYSGAGGLAGFRDEGTFSSSAPSYWDTTLTTYGMNSSSSSVSGATGKTKTQMQEAAFVTLLNENKETYKEWMEDDTVNEGYPIHLRASVPVDTEEPQITGQPVDKTVNVGGTASLSVTASVSKGVLSYQWYSNATRSSTGGTLITGATDDEYSTPTGTAGTTYYYCVVTNTDATATGSQTAEKVSDAAEVVVNALTNAEEPQITGQPVDKTVNVGGTAALSVTASVSKGTLSYQWYSNTTRSNAGGTLITDATDDEYSAPTTTAGTAYYYCMVTNTDATATGSQSAEKASDAAEVVVNEEKPYKPTASAVSIAYNSINITWSQVSGADGYEILQSTENDGNYSLVYTAAQTVHNWVKTGLTTGKTYYYRVRAFKMVGGKPLYSEFSDTVSAEPVPSVPTFKLVSTTFTSLTTLWNAVSGATGYEVWYATQKYGVYSLKYTASSGAAGSFNRTGLKTDRIYYVKVRAFTTVNGSKVYGTFSTINSSTPGRVSIVVARASTTSAKISWVSMSGAAGYEVWRSTQKHGTYTLKYTASSTKTTWVNSGLKTGKAYYYMVRAYKMVSGKKVYGQFSPINSIIP